MAKEKSSLKTQKEAEKPPFHPYLGPVTLCSCGLSLAREIFLKDTRASQREHQDRERNYRQMCLLSLARRKICSDITNRPNDIFAFVTATPLGIHSIRDWVDVSESTMAGEREGRKLFSRGGNHSIESRNTFRVRSREKEGERKVEAAFRDASRSGLSIVGCGAI